MKKILGSVSLFSAMIFLLVASVITATIQSARIQGAKVKVSTALSMGLDSVFAGYDAKLFSQFGVLLLNGTQNGTNVDSDMIAGMLSEYMEYNVDSDKGLYFAKDTDLYGIDLEGISVERTIGPIDEGGLIWMDMVTDYEKYAKVIDLAAGYLGIEDTTEEAKAVDEISEGLTSVAEKIVVVNESARNMIEKIDGVICYGDGMNIENPFTKLFFIKRFCPYETTVNGMNIPNQNIVNAVKSMVQNPFDYIDEAIEKNNQSKLCSAQVKKIVKLINECTGPLNEAIQIMESIESSQIEIDSQISLLDELIESKKSIIEEETMEGIMDEYENICEYNEILLEDICDIETMGKTLRADKRIFEDILKIADGIDYTQPKEEIEKSLIEIKKLIAKFSFEGLRFEYANLVIEEDNTDILDSIKDFIETGFLSIIVPNGTAVSIREIKETNLASSECDTDVADEIQASGNFATIEAKRLIYSEYVMDNFVCFTDEKEGAALNYEVEYVLFGGSSDKDNLTSAVLTIATIRSGVNMIYLLSDTDKREAVYGIAANLVGAGKMEPLIRIVQFALLYLWAYAEALMDVRTLLKGEEIAFTKSDETWQLSIENLMSLNFEDTGVKQEGIDYEGFLRFLLFMEDDGKKSAFTMDLVELWMINNGRKDFRLKNYIYGVEVTAAYEVAGGYRYTEKAAYTY